MRQSGPPRASPTLLFVERPRPVDLASERGSELLGKDDPPVLPALPVPHGDLSQIEVDVP